ncbi:M48 family metallopeptidase [Falsiroseomonas sp.]|uniref:M48 family metallopeptidase n=1 Tax=Falsiroseomonas sp. TaxID=2870721 RepID=UPI0027207043|nr:SprT family zinc-dependent metalloprotease [Falsiroseomonas sp.]MDO9499576.1 SprT family zinc-dependent metalloprotease [Falsiroseomonas sp.]
MTEAEIIALPEAGGSCQVQWRRSSRARRVSLRICPRQGAVVVVLPPQAARRAGLALLRANGPWVLARLSALAPANKLLDGGRVMLGGRDCIIRHDPAAAGAALDGDGIVLGGAAADLPGRVVDFLRAEARRRIGVLAARHGQALAVQPAAILVKDTRSRWGSCAPDGTLAFSWRLVMAPDWVLDYAVAHEVAHLREMNHSARFWAHVSRLTPHRNAAAAWLRTYGPTLLRVG